MSGDALSARSRATSRAWVCGDSDVRGEKADAPRRRPYPSENERKSGKTRTEPCSENRENLAANTPNSSAIEARLKSWCPRFESGSRHLRTAC